MAARIIFLSSKSLDSSSYKSKAAEVSSWWNCLEQTIQGRKIKKKQKNNKDFKLVMYHLVQELLIFNGGKLFGCQFFRALHGFHLSAWAIGDGRDLTRHRHGWSGWKHWLGGNNGFSLHLCNTDRRRVKHQQINMHVVIWDWSVGISQNLI